MIVVGSWVVALAITSLVMTAHLWQLLNLVKVTIDDTGKSIEPLEYFFIKKIVILYENIMFSSLFMSNKSKIQNFLVRYIQSSILRNLL